MAPLADRPFNDLLADVAAQTPAPGGGSSSAWTCAIAAALVQMAAAFAQGSDAEAIEARAAQLRADALRLAERELGAYAPVLEALRLPRDDPERDARVKATLSDAADSPLAIARAAATVAELAAKAADATSRHVRGDAQVAALLAHGACGAAARLVAINLASQPDDPRHAEVADLERRAAAAASARDA